jgi:hypothetical protein
MVVLLRKVLLVSSSSLFILYSTYTVTYYFIVQALRTILIDQTYVCHINIIIIIIIIIIIMCL